jgi:hypothetical protein
MLVVEGEVQHKHHKHLALGGLEAVVTEEGEHLEIMQQHLLAVVVVAQVIRLLWLVVLVVLALLFSNSYDKINTRIFG